MGKYYRINQFIQAKEVRVVNEKGIQLGVMSVFNAIQKARELGVDLVEVAGKANPPVAKIIDFKKFKYLEAKKEQEERRGKKNVELKEIQFSPFIAKNDLDFRIRKATGFIKEGNKVRICVRFTGREVTKKQFGYQVINQVVESLSDIAVKETEPKQQGKEIYLILTPNKKSKKEELNKNAET